MHERLSKSRLGISAEIRRRLEKSLELDRLTPETRALMDAIANFAVLVRLQTGEKWHSHPAAHLVMQTEITARLGRSKPDGEPVFVPKHLPKVRPVASDDPHTMGLALEAIEFHQQPIAHIPLRKWGEQSNSGD
jgi:hypothetical protein